MKTIAQTVSMKGQQETITLSEFRAKPGEVFTQVALGKEFTVTKNDQPVAIVKPPEAPFDWRALYWLRRIPA